jgi:hypothetical protein
VEVVGGPDVATDTDIIEALGSAQDANNHLGEIPAGPKKETTMDGTASHLDQGTAVWNEAKGSAHTGIGRKIDPETFSP